MKLLSFLILAFIIFISCDPCRNLDCVSSDYNGQFRITNSTDGIDLLFGNSAIYDKNKIKLYAVKGNDTIYLEIKTVKFPGASYDSILVVVFIPKPELAYLNLGNGDIDTLKISYRTYDTRCCGEITEITNFRYNNSFALPNDKGIVELKK